MQTQMFIDLQRKKHPSRIQNPKNGFWILDHLVTVIHPGPESKKKILDSGLSVYPRSHWVWKMKVYLTAEKQAELRRLYNYNNQMNVKGLKSINTLINHIFKFFNFKLTCIGKKGTDGKSTTLSLTTCCIDKEAERVTTEFSSQDELSWVMSGVRVLGIKFNEWQLVVPDWETQRGCGRFAHHLWWLTGQVYRTSLWNTYLSKTLPFLVLSNTQSNR